MIVNSTLQFLARHFAGNMALRNIRASSLANDAHICILAPASTSVGAVVSAFLRVA
jgi:hypothetical protein